MGFTSPYTDHDVGGLTAALVDPRRVDHGWAGHAFEVLHALMQESPDPTSRSMAERAVSAWLRRVHPNHAWFPGRVRLETHYWPESPQRPRAFRALEQLLDLLLSSSDDFTWAAGVRAIATAGDDTVGLDGPEEQSELLRHAAHELLRQLDGAGRWRRVVIEDLLLRVLVHPALADLRRDWIAARSDDIGHRVWRYTFWSEAIARSTLLEAWDQGGMTALWPLWHRRGGEWPTDVAEDFAQRADAVDIVREILAHADDRTAGLVPDVHRTFVRVTMLVDWAHRRPDLARPLLEGPTWRDAGPGAKAILMDILGGAFPDDVATVLSRKNGRGYVPALARFLSRPDACPVEEASGWIRLLSRVHEARPSLDLLVGLIKQTQLGLDDELVDWWHAAAASPGKDPRNLDASLRALLRRPLAPTVLGRLCGRLRWLKEYPTSDAPRLAWLLDALEAAHTGSTATPWSTPDFERDWLIPALIEDRPDRFWAIHWSGCSSAECLEEATLTTDHALRALRAAPLATDAHCEPWGFGRLSMWDALVEILTLEQLLSELQTSSSPRRRWLLMAAGMREELLDHTVAELAIWRKEDCSEAELGAHQMANGRGASGLRGRIRLMPDFPDRPAPEPDPIADLWEERARVEGGPLGDLLHRMAATHRHANE
jgi:hypothetical protein